MRPSDPRNQEDPAVGRALPVPDLTKGLPDDFVKVGSAVVRSQSRRRRQMVDRIANGLGGNKTFQEIVLAQAFSDLLKTEDDVATCVSRAFRNVVDEEDLGRNRDERKENLRRKQRQKRASIRDASADSVVSEPLIRHVDFNDPATEAEASRPAPDVELSIDVLKALSELNPDEQELIGLHFQDGFTVRAIAARLGRPRATTGRRVEAARKKLAGILKKNGLA